MKTDFFTKITDPTHEYSSYSWFENDFDGYYILGLTRSVFGGQPTISVSFDKY